MARWRESDNARVRPSSSRAESERPVFDAIKAEHSQELWPLIDRVADVAGPAGFAGSTG
jgi:hypothetical protein